MMYQWWMSWSRAVLMVCVLCLVFVTGVVGKHSLFEGSKYVMEVTTFEMGALNVDARMCPTVMLFYADMCGHCRKFAPVYAASAEKLHEDSARAAETYSLYGRSIITSVNCMRGGNLHLCTSVNITGVPVLGLWIPRMLPSAPRTASLLDTHTFYRVTLPSGADVPTLLATAWNHQRPQGWNAENEKHCGSVVANLPNGRGEYSVAPVEPATNIFVEEHSVMASDIINGFFFMMNHEVPLSGLDTVEKVIALRVFLATVTSHLPGIGAEPLLRFLRNVTVGTKITQSEWLAQVKAAQIPIAGEPNDLHWKTCQGSSWKFRGPPCGQWLLFHSLTVNFAKPSSNTEDGGFVFSVIRGYVEHFLSCLPCRKHFLRFKPRSGECSLLALWRAHNVANRFLAEDPTAANDPLVPKVQYPTAERCPICYTPPEEGDEDGIDLEQVTQFIFRTFHYPNPLKDDSSVNFVDYNYLNAHFPPRKVRRRRPIFSKQLVTAPYLLFPIVIACLFFVTRRHLRRSLPISRMLSGKNRHE